MPERNKNTNACRPERKPLSANVVAFCRGTVLVKAACLTGWDEGFLTGRLF